MASNNVSKMTSAKASQQPTPENQTSSPFTAASNTSNAANAQESTVPPVVNNFRDLSFPLWKNEGDTSFRKGPVSGGIHSSPPRSQHTHQNHTHAARTTDNNDRNDTARKLPQSFDPTAQHLADIGPSTSRSMTAAEHGEGFVRPETSGSGFSDPIDTDESSLLPRRVNSRGPPSRTPDEDAGFDPAVNDDEDSDDALIEQAMRGSFQSITRSWLPNGRKKSLLLRAVCEFRRHSEGHSDISAMVDGVSVSLRRTKEQNLRWKLLIHAKKLDEIREHVTQFTVPLEALATADGGRKRKTSSTSDTEEHTQPSKKKSRPSPAIPTQEKAAGESDPEKHERLSNTYANQIVILNNDLGNAADKVRYSMSFYKDALVVSTDGSYGFSPASGHAGAGMAWPAPETDNEASSPDAMKWYGISWPLGKGSDGQPISTAYAERTAIRLALRTIKWKDMAVGRQSLVIQTDSQTCLHQIKDGLEGKSRYNDVNDIVLYVQALRSQFDVKLIWVKGHHQCTGNRMADRYAHGGRVSSELGSPAITSLDHSAPPGEVRTYAAGVLDKPRKKPTCDAGTQTEPLMEENEGGTAEAAHALQGSSESATTTDGFLPVAEPYKTGMSTSPAPTATLPDEAPGTADAQGTSLSTAVQTKLQNHVGATIQLAHFSLATNSAGSSAFAEDDASKNEGPAPKIVRRRWNLQRID
ncbi:hypothetical protein KC331_g366 [Hortaea werneckii]|nr:hypothetical protein KC331_g366 [Hortaea werneckii]